MITIISIDEGYVTCRGCAREIKDTYMCVCNWELQDIGYPINFCLSCAKEIATYWLDYTRVKRANE